MPGPAVTRVRTWLWVVLVGAVVLALWPVWTSPVQADDRYWYLKVTSDFGGSTATLLAQAVADTDPSSGRVTPLAFLVRRLAAVQVLDLAVTTGVPVAVWHGLVKVLMTTAAVAVGHGLLRSLRRRGPDGLVPLSRGTHGFVLAGLVAAMAAGAQTQAPFRNAWVAYPILTVGAVVVVLGTMALLVARTRAVGRGGPGAVLVTALVGVVLGVLLNTTYELYYVAVPATVVLVLLLPATDAGRRRDEWRAKLLALGPFVVTFLVLLLVIRDRIAAVCEEPEQGCYEGTEPALGRPLVVTALRNLLGAVPVFGRSELRQDLANVTASPQLPPPVTLSSVLLGLLVAVVLLLLWRRGPVPAPAPSAEDGAAARRAEAGILLRAGAVMGLVALGTAGIMALSVQAQEIIQSLGLPYRHTVVTWTALALTALLGLRALALLRPDRSAVLTVVPALVLGALVAVTLPVNVAATWADRSAATNVLVARVHGEVIREDPSAEGDLRRCQTVADAYRDVGAAAARARLLEGADGSYRLLHGVPYCSEGLDDPSEGTSEDG